MFSIGKSSARSGSDESVAGGISKVSVPSDEVASAVAAVSDEIGDILKDELGDADRADRIGAELADLSAELGLLAGLADEPQQDFPSLFEIAFSSQIGHRASGSGSSSSSWSGGRGGRSRRLPRPQRAPRRRPIAKGKEMSRRRSAVARRAASMRVRRVEVVSDASDVGADSDSDDQWTELDDNSGSTDCSSGKEVSGLEIDCPPYQHKGSQVEAPPMGQFLLPLLSADPTAPDPEHFLIRHEDILQLLASAEDSVRDELPLEDDAGLDSAPDVLTGEMYECEDPVVTPEDEAALLHYVCAEHPGGETEAPFKPVEEWLLGVYHSWCEISALMYTLIGTNMTAEMVKSEWSYRARFGCHCRLCLSLANNSSALHRFLAALIVDLAHGGNTASIGAKIVQALHLVPGRHSRPNDWDIPSLQRLKVCDDGASIIHEHLTRLSRENETTNEIVNSICLCRAYDRPFEKIYAMERFSKLMENFKTASTITFKVEMVPSSGSGSGSGDTEGDVAWGEAVRSRLARCLAPHQRRSTSERLAHMAARTAPHDLSAWSGYKHRCDCLTPRTLCAQQRKQLLRISFFGMMQAVNEFNGTKADAEKPTIDMKPDNSGRELQQGDGTGAKPPDNLESRPPLTKSHSTDSNITIDLDDLSDSDANSGTASLGLSTSSSLDSASELLLAAAAAVESGGSSGEGDGQLCRTVRQLMNSIASIERLMDRVLQHCDQWTDHEARKRVHVGLSEVDRKLMAMYRRLPDVHRRQLQLYRKQKRLSTVCTQLVGGRAPAPPPPGSPPPAPAHTPCRPLCPEYHLQRFKEVRRKVMHMRDQQLYYHRLRMWLEDQLRQERESLPESNVTLIEDLPRRKRRTASPKNTKITTASKRKLKPANISQTISKPHKILQMLRHKAPVPNDINIKSPYKEIDDEPSLKSEVEPPEAFPLEKEDNISDAETIVGEKETGDICKEMRECLAKFANFALNSPDNNLKEEFDVKTEPVKYPESVSPPLQEMSPTTSEPMPVYTQNPRRILAVNKLFNKDDKVVDFQSQIIVTETRPKLNTALNNTESVKVVTEVKVVENADDKDTDVYKYVTFGLKIKKAMEECQNIINSYNSVSKDEKPKEDIEEPPSLEQIIEVMMTLDKNSAEFLEKMDSDDPIDMNIAINKLSELVENMPQTLSNMPEIASKLSEFANANFELPEFASIMNSLPDVNNEAQLTPETLKQIRELKLSRRDSVKVTKNTAKRKINRRIKSNDNDLAIFEFDGKDLSELLRDEKELQNMMNNKNNKEDFKDLLCSMSAQVVINKVFDYVKQNKNPEQQRKFLEEEKVLFSLPRNINSEIYSKVSTLFDNSVKDALSMDDLRKLIKSKFNSWKHYIAIKCKGIPIDLLDNEIESMLDKFYSYIQDLASKQCSNESDRLIDKIDELKRNSDSDIDDCPASQETMKQITKLLSTFAGNTLDLLVMKLSKLSDDKKTALKNLKLKYMDVIRRCAESQQLAGWILLDPGLATNVIQELTGLEVRKLDNVPDFSTLTEERKKEYFIDRLKEMNMQYMQRLPKKGLTGDEWLVILYRLEQLGEKLKEAFSKLTPAPKVTSPILSEAEILAAKGLSKIIGKANVRIVKKTNPEPPPPPPPKPKKEPEVEVQAQPLPTNEKDDKKAKNDALLAKCEAILTSKGEKSLLDSFYTIKSYITQGLQVPETYKKHVISICSSIDAKLLDEDIEETLKLKTDEQENLDAENKDKAPLSVIGSQNPELLAKYSAQALRNAKQTLNAVAFRNMTRNGQSKSESDVCDTPKTNCKWTNDCVCDSCKDSDVSSVSLGDIVKQCYDDKSKNSLEEKNKKEVKKVPPKQKPSPKPCENANHQQHVCKVAHGGVCSGEGAADQPCNCCYCTVFGHAPPLTTPVPRNFNETRERLRSILNKKKQKCKTTANGEVESPVERSPPQPQAPAPPALPKSLPPNLTMQALQKRQAMENQQKQLADKMAKMVVTEKPDNKPKAVQRSVPVQTIPSAVKAEGKVNPNAMEQIRLQQLKQQQQSQLQQQIQHQQQQQQQQQQLQQQQQKKPEPIYDLPIHNKPTLTPQQQQQIRLQQQQHHDEMVRQNHLHLQQQIQHQQKQLQQHEMQQQLQHQQLEQHMRQGRQQQQQNAVSLSSRDTSAFSFSSGCSGGSCWRGRGGCNNRAEDPRDLDALLQYIEGPARHVDRGKKRAKKMRQKAKRMEGRLCEQLEELQRELASAQAMVTLLKQAHASASRDLEMARQSFTAQRTKKKGKKQKLNQTQQNKVQLVSEQLSDYTSLVNNIAKELKIEERRVAECSSLLKECERELSEARTVQGKADEGEVNDKHHQREREAMMNHQQYQQQRLQQYKQEKTAQMMLDGFADGSTMRVSHSDGSAVTLSLRGQPDPALARLISGTDFKVELCEEQSAQKQTESQKKQTWEQAIAHMNQLAKGSAKEKKKQKEVQSQKTEVKKEKPITPPTPEQQPLSKKQRKLLAKQQAEEEERRLEQQLKQEVKSKKDKKTEPLQTDNTKKEQKKEDVKKKKEEKKEVKKDEKKGKENKIDKSATTAKTKTTTQQPQQNNKKEKKKESKPQVINITADTTIEMVSKKNQNVTEPEKPASCSIMEQLSCGVQVADLKLPPGITLTRVQPSEKKEPPTIKSVPLWKHNQLEATPTPVPRPPPVINADPSMMMFTTHQPNENAKPIIPDPQPQPAGKSKKAKKKAKKAAETEQKQEGAKMVTLRNPMFHPNLPPVQITNTPPQKKSEIRIPDPIPMPPAPCQATITPTSNGMYTIRNPLMSMMHQQNLMGIRNQSPQMNPMYNQAQYNYANPNAYNPQYVHDPSRNSPKNTDSEFQNRIMNLASFAQNNVEGYSLFKTPEENSQQKSFLAPEFYEDQNPKVVSPNPIGTRPDQIRNYENDSLFANPVRPEPIGTPLKIEEERLYTPFGQENRNVFRNALFNDKPEMTQNVGKTEDSHSFMPNGDQLPYFQRLRAGSKLNSEVTIHYVTDSKFYKGQEGQQMAGDSSLFSRPHPASWAEAHGHTNSTGMQSSVNSMTCESACDSGGATTPQLRPESSVFIPDRSNTNLLSSEVSSREMESLKRFELYTSPLRPDRDGAAPRHHHK